MGTRDRDSVERDPVGAMENGNSESGPRGGQRMTGTAQEFIRLLLEGGPSPADARTARTASPVEASFARCCTCPTNSSNFMWYLPFDFHISHLTDNEKHSIVRLQFFVETQEGKLQLARDRCAANLGRDLGASQRPKILAQWVIYPNTFRCRMP